jgi:predicted amidohydrolase
MAETTIACVQMDCGLGDVEANRRAIVGRLREAAARGAELVVFPECAATGYCFDSLAEAAPFAEPLEGATARAVAAACRETGAHAVVGFIERDGEKFYNAAMLVAPGGVAGSYRKTHLPFLGVDRYLTPGDREFRVFDLPRGKVGINVCYDVSFPEPARVLKLLGAQLVVLPTNWPPGAWRAPEFVVRARALENHVYYAAANRVGTERGWRFIGRSKILDCDGETLAEADGDGEEIIYARADLSRADDNHIVNVAGSYEIDRLKDRRPELYAQIVAKDHEVG